MFVLTLVIDNRFSLHLMEYSRVMDTLHTIFNVRIHWKLIALCHGTNAYCPPELPW